MRPALRLLAAVKPAGKRYLEAGAPTGLTGLHSHPSPHNTLLYLYQSTLAKLQAIPETSVYRQSVEAVTKQRMAAVATVQPEGYAEWEQRALAWIEQHPDHVEKATGGDKGLFLLFHRTTPAMDPRRSEWDGYASAVPTGFGVRPDDVLREDAGWENGPDLTIDQIEELENKIGAGLIEEVIQVAEGELKLVDTMVTGKVWESLDEKPVEGQWEYFERKA